MRPTPFTPPLHWQLQRGPFPHSQISPPNVDTELVVFHPSHPSEPIEERRARVTKHAHATRLGFALHVYLLRHKAPAIAFCDTSSFSEPTTFYLPEAPTNVLHHLQHERDHTRLHTQLTHLLSHATKERLLRRKLLQLPHDPNTLLWLLRSLFLLELVHRQWLPFDISTLHSLLNSPTDTHALLECCNTPPTERPSRLRSPTLDTIPYLNGGLFTLNPNDTPPPLGALLHLAQELLLLQLDDPYGYLFQHLIPPDERKELGCFFTPTHLAAELTHHTLHTALHRLCPSWDASQPTLDPTVARQHSALLTSLRILDPAAGSGTFLHHALTFLLHQHEHLAAVQSQPFDRSHTLRHILTQQLYAIERHPIAHHILQWRLWTTASHHIPHPTPLPNLNHHLRLGNALLSTHQLRTIDNRALLASFTAAHQSLTAEYVHAHGSERTRITQQLATLESSVWHQLTNQASSHAPGFHPNLHFQDVLASGGFHVILGNPPWTPLAKLPPAERQQLRAHYALVSRHPSRRRHQRTTHADLYVAFLERMLQWLHPQGVASVVVPSKFLQAPYAASARTHLLRNHHVSRIRDDSHHGQTLFDAATYPIALTFSGSPPPTDATTAILHADQPPRTTPTRTLVNRHDGTSWNILPPTPDHPSSNAGYARIATLREHLTPHLGIKTGCNRVFLNPDLPPSTPHLLPCLRGAHLHAFNPQPADRLLFCYDTKSAQPLSDIPPALHTYLAGHTSALHSRVDWHPIPSPWHLQRVRPSSLGHRVAWRDIAPELCAAPLLPVHQGGPLLLNTAYYVAAPSHQLAIRWTCWLNSPPIRTLARNSAQQALHGYFRFLAHTVGALPFPFFLFDPEPIDDLDRLANELATQPAAYPDLSAELARTVTELLAAERAFLADRGLSLCPAT